ncbi:cyclic nucleotide-binding domain-containing protein [Magnetococcales bacterium HHB-1]
MRKVKQEPVRWQHPLSHAMDEKTVDKILDHRGLHRIVENEHRFPKHLSLQSILKYDTRIDLFDAGKTIATSGKDGHSAYFILSGSVRLKTGVVTSENREKKHDRTLLSHVNFLYSKYLLERTIPKDEEDKRPSLLLKEGEIFGEISALTPANRHFIAIAEEETKVLRIRWPGLQTIRRYAPSFKKWLDLCNRKRLVALFFLDSSLFLQIPNPDLLNKIIDATIYESYGNWDWQNDLSEVIAHAEQNSVIEDVQIIPENAIADHLIIMLTGYGRLCQTIHHGQRSVGFIGPKRIFALPEISIPVESNYPFELRALGYVEILKIPAHIIRQYLIPYLPKEMIPTPSNRYHDGLRELSHNRLTGFIEFMIENHFVVGSSVAIIDLDRCIRCKTCISVCQKGHKGHAHIELQGRIYNHLLIAQSCLHCTDSICMVDCPTGAIYRTGKAQRVTISSENCIGCGLCVRRCPFGLITLIENEHASILSHRSKSKVCASDKIATKCDLCMEKSSLPSCVQRCPQHALYRANMNDMRGLYRWFGL